jgi:hypothetical protein
MHGQVMDAQVMNAQVMNAQVMNAQVMNEQTAPGGGETWLLWQRRRVASRR